MPNGHDNGDWADAKLVISDEADKGALKEALDAAETLRETDYTAETFIALQAAITAAKAVYEDENATQTQVNTMLGCIAEAIEALKVPGASEYWELVAQLKEKEDEADGLRDELLAKEEELNQEKENVSTLSGQLSEARQEAERLNSQLEAANERIAELEAAGGSSEEVKKWKDEAERLRGQLAQANSDVTRLTGELSEANGRITVLTGQNQTLTGQINGLQNEITRLNQELAAANTNIDTLNQALLDARKEVSDLEESLRNANDNIAKLQASGSAKDSEIELWKSQAEKFEELLNTANANIIGLTERIGALEKELLEEKEKADKLAEEARLEAERLKAEAERQKAEAQAALEKALLEAEHAKKELEGFRAKAQTALKNGDIRECGGVIYRVSNADKKEASAYRAGKNSAKSITVLDTVLIGGVTCKVTSISANAFSLMPGLKKAVIGKNVKTIGKKAFYGSAKLKEIRVKSTGLKKVNKNALKQIHPKAVIQVPKAKKRAYAKLFAGKGQKKTVKIK